MNSTIKRRFLTNGVVRRIEAGAEINFLQADYGECWRNERLTRNSESSARHRTERRKRSGGRHLGGNRATVRTACETRVPELPIVAVYMSCCPSPKDGIRDSTSLNR
jgi:hypothetical protein